MAIFSSDVFSLVNCAISLNADSLGTALTVMTEWVNMKKLSRMQMLQSLLLKIGPKDTFDVVELLQD